MKFKKQQDYFGKIYRQIVQELNDFLGHRRTYVFQNDRNEEIYLRSADWMKRKLDRRIEVITSIYDEAIANEFRIQLNDNV